jgi:hypothetical protein
LAQLLGAGLVCVLNFLLHAMVTGIIIVATRHTAAMTDDLSIFLRVTALLLVTTVTLACAHVAEVALWAVYYSINDLQLREVTAFAFAFENYTAIGYGDELPKGNLRLIGPVTALNGLLLIGWSVAIIFEVLRMAEIHIRREPK